MTSLTDWDQLLPGELLVLGPNSRGRGQPQALAWERLAAAQVHSLASEKAPGGTHSPVAGLCG